MESATLPKWLAEKFGRLSDGEDAGDCCTEYASGNALVLLRLLEQIKKVDLQLAQSRIAHECGDDIGYEYTHAAIQAELQCTVLMIEDLRAASWVPETEHS